MLRDNTLGDKKNAAHAKLGHAPRVLLQLSGSIAGFKAVALASKLVQAGMDLEVVMSTKALEFVGAASFEGLTRKPVYKEVFEAGQNMAHIDLERWADVILLYPATANQLANLAHGLGGDLISTLFLAHEFKKPYLIAPAMNPAMWNHPATRENVRLLKGYGVKFLEPEAGPVACGEEGTGRLMEPEHAFVMIERALGIPLAEPTSKIQNKSTRGKILVTAGGTQEPIDPVRSITNVSTGRTGYRMASILQSAGYEVTLVQSLSSKFVDGIAQVLTYTTTQDLSEVVQSELNSHSYDWMIHSAAVADFRVEEVKNAKISSDEPMMLKLVPNPKIISKVRGWSQNKKLKMISFKLTTEAAVGRALGSYDSEWIIHNEIKKVQAEDHAGTVYQRQNGDYQRNSEFHTKTELADKILNIIQSEVRS